MTSPTLAGLEPCTVRSTLRPGGVSSLMRLRASLLTAGRKALNMLFPSPVGACLARNV